MKQPELGLLIAQKRKERGWSRSQLAGLVNGDTTTISRWERGESVPYVEHRKKLMEVLKLDASVFAFEEQTFALNTRAVPPYWTVPHLRNPYFTGRRNLLESLHVLMFTPTSANLVHAMTGLGGIGKTQLAVEYAYLYSKDREEYNAVLWAQASSKEELFSSFTKIADVLKLEEKQQQNQQVVVEAVKHWLESHTNWLLILDNVEDLEDLPLFLPQRKVGHTGHILLTTRCQAVGMVAAVPFPVEPMSREEGTTFLLRRANKLKINFSLDMAEAEDRKKALSLSIILGDLPLALDQAGAYVEETGCTLSQYIEHYQTQRAFLLRRRGIMTQYNIHPEPVTVTFLLSLTKIEQKNPAAADLLRLCAFVAPDDIAEDFLLRCHPALPLRLQSLLTSPVLFDEALALIRRYSLIQRLATKTSLSVHRVVQAVIQDDLEKKKQREHWEEMVVEGVSNAFSFAGQNNVLEEYERDIPHALACVSLINDQNFESEAAGHLLFITGYYLTRHAHYTQAEPLCQKALNLYKRLLGPVHPEVASNLSNLANLYEEMRLHTKAQALFVEAIEILEKAQPLDPFALAVTRSNLSHCYWLQGEFAKAEKLSLQSLSTLEQFAEAKPNEFATGLTNRATIYRDQGKGQQAGQLYQRALSIYERIFSPDHLDIAYCLEAIATNTVLQGESVRAEPLYRRALSIFETVWGPKHPDVASCLCRLADVCTVQGEYALAEKYNRQALAIYEEIGGPEYLEVNQPLLGLAMLYAFRGKKAEAEEFYRRAITIIEKSQGPEHPDLVAAFMGYAELLVSQGKRDDARKLLTRAKEIEHKILK